MPRIRWKWVWLTAAVALLAQIVTVIVINLLVWWRSL
jgi:hypothetical protein